MYDAGVPASPRMRTQSHPGSTEPVQALHDHATLHSRDTIEQSNKFQLNRKYESMDNEEFLNESTERGSDDLLSDDSLRLPDSANTLVRIHAVRAWLTRREMETSMEIGEAALTLQQAFEEPPQETRLRRRERTNQNDTMFRVQRAQQALEEAQQRLSTYEEAQAILEDCVAHTTSGERVLVEYYLTLEDLMQSTLETPDASRQRTAAFSDVQHRVEQVGAPNEE